MIIHEEASHENSHTELESWATLFKSLGDPHRLQIIQHLQLGEHRVADLVDHLGLAQSTVSTHVASLRNASHTHGRATYYTLAHPQETTHLLKAATAVLTTADTCIDHSQQKDTNHV
ncbi:metalloregulator ArsR/SmtB family transcription factor [Brevibacterium sp. UMB1308A]|nr:metalloregulator ArsR/SmtB family transcription factor [Brevibacterium sp. UMB1308A]MDK8345623.1 metalloregulator ArsR/SmtB family transcription factor [Brevibacterium sp. UMB1308B]MDK8713227.1 metalloregulator ArsR/SmtB family transcription factor [Brevibacterium sp. UMB1308A]